MSGLIERARKLKKTIVFPEGDDPRVLEAAARLAREGVVKPVLIGAAPGIAPEGVTFVEPANSPLPAEIRRALLRAPPLQGRHPGGGRRNRARGRSTSPPSWWPRAMPMAAWAAPSTAPPKPCAPRSTASAPTRARAWSRASSSWRCRDRSLGHNGLMAFADCAVVIDPTPTQLADIAIATAESTRVLIDTEPAVALLSFSTKGSGKHPQVDKVVEALRIVQARAPELNVDGELQADAAVSPVVGQVQGARVEGGGPRQHAGVSRTWPPPTSATSWWSGWAAPWPSGRSCRGWPSPPTIFRAAARRKTSSTSRW